MDKYLKNGTLVQISHETETHAFVETYIQPLSYYNEEEEEDFELSGNLIQVEKKDLYDSPPIAVIDKEIQAKSAELEAIKAIILSFKNKKRGMEWEKKELDREILNRKTELEKGIIFVPQIKAAKSIHFFEENYIEPKQVAIKKRQPYNYELRFSGRYIKGDKQETIEPYIYNVQSESWENSPRVDLECGLLIDKTEEEILSLTIERSKKMPDAYDLTRVNKKYLSEEAKRFRAERLKVEKENKRKSLEEEIQKLTQQLKDIS